MGFRVLGVPVRVEVVFLLAMAFLGWSMGREGAQLVLWLVVASGSVLVHELGHALAFRRFGARPEVVLYGFGGYTTGAAQPPLRSIVVSAAGPAVGLVVGTAVLLGGRSVAWSGTAPGLLEIALFDLVFVNLGWGLFNLLPMLPLDGGNIVAATFEAVTGGRGQGVARIVSLVTAVLVGVAAVLLRQPFVAVLVGYLAWQNLAALGQARDEPHLRRLDHARRLLLAGEVDASLAAALEVSHGAPSRAVTAAATEVEVWALLSLDRPTDASSALARAGGGVGISQLARTMVTLALGRASGSVPPSLPLAAAFAATGDAVAARVAAAIVGEVGLVERTADELAALPPAQAERGFAVLAQGLHAAGRQSEAELVEARRARVTPEA